LTEAAELRAKNNALTDANTKLLAMAEEQKKIDVAQHEKIDRRRIFNEFARKQVEAILPILVARLMKKPLGEDPPLARHALTTLFGQLTEEQRMAMLAPLSDAQRNLIFELLGPPTPSGGTGSSSSSEAAEKSAGADQKAPPEASQKYFAHIPPEEQWEHIFPRIDHATFGPFVIRYIEWLTANEVDVEAAPASGTEPRPPRGGGPSPAPPAR